MWLGLCRHLDIEDTKFVLAVLLERSGWREAKRSRNEVLRKEYLRLYDECKHYSPQWEHTAMKERREGAQRAKASEDAATDNR